jgi:hypothetical protein
MSRYTRTMTSFGKSWEAAPLSCNFLLRRLLVILCLSLCTAMPTKALAGKGYRDASAIDYQVIEIQKKYGMPVEHNKGENPWYWISYSPHSITLKFHQADEIPQQAVLDIIKLCMAFYEKDGRKGRYRILMYRESHEAWRKSLFIGMDFGQSRINPYFELTIGRKDN